MSRRLALPLILLLALAVGACTESAAEESPSRAPTSGTARVGDATGPARLTKALAAIEDLQKYKSSDWGYVVWIKRAVKYWRPRTRTRCSTLARR
jgi:hypothetical protein